MNEPYLTMTEIEAKFPNEWVLLDKLKKGRNGYAIGGVVLMHTPDRAEFDRRLVERNEFPQVVEGAILYMGRTPELAKELLASEIA